MGTPRFEYHALPPNPMPVVHVPGVTCTVGVTTAEASRYSSLVAVRKGLIAQGTICIVIRPVRHLAKWVGDATREFI